MPQLSVLNFRKDEVYVNYEERLQSISEEHYRTLMNFVNTDMSYCKKAKAFEKAFTSKTLDQHINARNNLLTRMLLMNVNFVSQVSE